MYNVTRPTFEDTATEEIFKAPLTANAHHCEHMKKNQKTVQKTASLELLGENSVIGLPDVINRSPFYSRSVMCLSPTAELIYVHKDDFLALKKNEKVWNAIHENIEQRSDNMARKFKEQAAAEKFI